MVRFEEGEGFKLNGPSSLHETKLFAPFTLRTDKCYYGLVVTTSIQVCKFTSSDTFFNQFIELLSYKL